MDRRDHPFGLALTDDEAVAGRSFLIGLGTLAGLLMIFVGITGVLRNRFASPAPVAARWRAMHMLAYPAWCAALVHGLYAGRSAKPIFLILYGLSLVGVMAALVVRASPARVKRRIADRVTTLLGLADQQRGPRGAGGGKQVPGGRVPPAGIRRRARLRAGRRPPARGRRPARRAPAVRDRRARPRPGTGERLRGRLPRGVDARPAGHRAPAPHRRDRPHGAAAGHAAHGGHPARGRPLQHLGQLADPVPAAGRRGSALVVRPAPDTGCNIPAYDNSAASGFGSRDVRDTGETNGLYATYNPSDTYNSGPANEPLPGASPPSSYDFDAPGSGEPWNTPSGGYK
ncbi:ferric reductase-like transmembrane domain-containing protein [Streptomyces heliomycini]